MRRRVARSRNLTWMTIVSMVILLLIVIPVGVVLGGGLILYAQAVSRLPTPQETIYLDPIIGPTRLYDSSGQTLIFSVQDPLGDERAWITLDQLPSYVVPATLLMEDPDFLDGGRFDPLQTLGKLWLNIIDGPLTTDLSLTGRLVRNAILQEPEIVTVDHRTQEIALIAELNRQYSPEEILEWHLNTNYYGNEVYGIDAAAQVYFNKSAAELTLDEAAMLAAIPPAPQYNPVNNETAAYGRQSDLLRSLLTGGYVTREQFEAASGRLTRIQPGAGQTPAIAPEFALLARRQAEDILTALGMDGARLVSRGGLQITTTLDLDLYYQAECVLRTHLQRLNGQIPDSRTLIGDSCLSASYLSPLTEPGGLTPPDEGALVLIEVETGMIRSMVGSADRVAYQPGPTLHPFVYFDGFISASSLITPATMVLDIPQTFPGAVEGLIYVPRNPDGEFHGPMNLREAMAAGLLQPAAQIANSEGLSDVLLIAHRLGINSLTEGLYDLSLLERGGAVSVLDIAYAYSVLSTMDDMIGIAVEPLARGFRERDPVAVVRIEDVDGKVLWNYDEEAIALSRTPKIEPSLGYLLNDILSDQQARRSVLGPPSDVLSLSRPAAVVNGLTSDGLDSWTVGYTPHIVTGVRLGRSDQQTMTLDVYGFQGAAPVWGALMEYAHDRNGVPARGWERPADIVETVVCERSGLIPDPKSDCPRRPEIFVASRTPIQFDSFWQMVEVNSQTGQKPTANTPAGLREQRLFFVPPDEALDWWRANNQPLPPEEFDTLIRSDILDEAQILVPEQLDYVGGEVDIRGSITAENMASFQMTYGAGVNPAQWFNIGEQQTEYLPGTSMGLWNTSALEDGIHSLRLSVIRTDSTRAVDTIQITVDNNPPTITLSAGEPEQIFAWPDDSVIPLLADVQDNLAIDRVEFYHNGQFVGEVKGADWPRGIDWEINRTGVEVFSAVAFDAVGNNASAEITVEVVRAGS